MTSGPREQPNSWHSPCVESSAQQGLSLQDPDMAAEHLLCLILSIPLNQAMLLGDEHAFTEAALDRYADEGVTAFLRAYGFSDG